MSNLIKGERELKYMIYIIDRYMDSGHVYIDYG